MVLGGRGHSLGTVQRGSFKVETMILPTILKVEALPERSLGQSSLIARVSWKS